MKSLNHKQTATVNLIPSNNRGEMIDRLDKNFTFLFVLWERIQLLLSNKKTSAYFKKDFKKLNICVVFPQIFQLFFFLNSKRRS